MDRFQMTEQKLMRIGLLTVLVLLALCLLAALILGVLHLTAPEPMQEPATDLSGSRLPYPTGEPSGGDASGEGTTSTGVVAHERLLAETADGGQDYIDSMIFFGESTTAHLRSRGVLGDGKNTTQVWSDSSNTMMLDLNILQKKIKYPASGVEMTVPEAAAIAKPKYIVLSFGVNGIYGFSKNHDLYRVSYGRLIDAIHQSSPETVVLLQTVYPVATNQTSFNDDAGVINGYIDLLNQMLPDIAKKHDAYVVDTASCLADARGFLNPSYADSDGLHLNKAAYLTILNYLRTHSYELQ